ncbi:DNA polymerase IV [Desulfallas sp. Bu1-1]|uniref:DNA polymerase IV n=1 Tax=Desulfallas sp. Bu1-1 TaxID=2787620 RepID=UPI00189D4F61|nr:DNA polymerase IV [Desulfallas sp. Bu1-1]MBF7083028.1 DNA polymerase IV [Desulfallas sp. Bu1-1]
MHIIHIDMDAFFASVEQRDNPELRGKPVAVGGKPEHRGVVAAASYEARKFGVRSAMPMATAIKLCPGLIVAPANHKKYREVSSSVMDIFHYYTPLVEPLSLDEAFLDVAGSERLFGSPVEIGAEIQRRIKNELQLSASVGIGPNKFIAKLASGYKKPGGFTVIPQEKVLDFLSPLPVEKMWGIGDKTAESLKRMGIKTIGQLRALPLKLLEEKFGKHGKLMCDFARGEDPRPVEPQREVKSMGKEVTFAGDVANLEELRQTLRELAEKVARRLRRENLKSGSVTLKIKYPDLRLITRTENLPEPTNLAGVIYRTASRLLDKHCKPPVRLIGITCGKLTGERYIALFRDEKLVNEEKITLALDKLRDRYGEDVVKVASLLKKRYK